MHGTFICDFPGFTGFPVLVGTLHIRWDFHSADWVISRGGTWGYCGGLGVIFFSPKFNQIWFVSYSHEWHMHQFFWSPPHGALGEGSKISFSEHGHVAYQIKGDEQ